MTQKQIIKEHLEEDLFIDNFFCIDRRITIRLGMHINLLRNSGMKISGCYGNRIENFDAKLKKKNAKNFYYFLEHRAKLLDNGNYKFN